MRIVVVGAGVAGLAATSLLARTGHEVTLLDGAPGLPQGGAGLLLQPNGIAVLDAIGVTPGIRPTSTMLRRVSLFDGAGRVLLTSTVPDFGGGLNEALMVSRADIMSALAQQCPVSVRWGSRVGHVAPGHVDVEDRNGRHTLPADLIVGADGVSSDVRTSAGLGRQRRGGRRYLRALVPAESAISSAGEYWTRSGLAGIFPCGSRSTYVFATATREIVDAHASGQDMYRVVGRAHPVLARYLPSPWPAHEVLVNEVSQVDCPRFVGPGIALVGDAAHAMAPNLGQGANSGLVDAAVLAQALATEADLPRALDRYDAARQSVRRVQRDADRLARFAHVKGVRSARDLLAQVAGLAMGESAIRRAMQVDPLRLRTDLHAMLS